MSGRTDSDDYDDEEDEEDEDSEGDSDEHTEDDTEDNRAFVRSRGEDDDQNRSEDDQDEKDPAPAAVPEAASRAPATEHMKAHVVNLTQDIPTIKVREHAAAAAVAPPVPSGPKAPASASSSSSNPKTSAATPNVRTPPLASKTRSAMDTFEELAYQRYRATMVPKMHKARKRVEDDLKVVLGDLDENDRQRKVLERTRDALLRTQATHDEQAMHGIRECVGEMAKEIIQRAQKRFRADPAAADLY
ncbi:MAG: hypothetical protein JKY23_00420 [Nitrospinaceae bacterium]|nr:hypothetical protein [Nitrospinaceae bacterium]